MPQGLTIVSNIRENEEPNLRALLEQLNQLGQLHFSDMQTVHYASWLILPGVNKGPSRLFLETNYDGTLGDHLTDLIANAGRGLDRIYSFCEGYRAASTPGEGIRSYFHNHKVRSSAYYVALPGRCLADIRNAIEVYEEARDFLNNLPTSGMSKREVDESLIAHFNLTATTKPKRFPVTQRRQRWRLGFNLGLPALLYVLLVEALCHFGLHRIAIFSLLFPILYAVVILLAGRCQEIIEEHRPPPPYDSTSHAEDFYLLNVGPQNHLCTLATLRRGWFRRYLAKQSMLLGTILSKYVFILGKLDLMPTIHFARWILMGNELVFLTNYDGSFSSYLSDFSDQAWGVNLVWGNTEGYPPTKFLVGAGAKDLDAFETQGLEHYFPALVFYSAYGEYPVQNILRYLEFRDDLARKIRHAEKGVC